MLKTFFLTVPGTSTIPTPLDSCDLRIIGFVEGPTTCGFVRCEGFPFFEDARAGQLARLWSYVGVTRGRGIVVRRSVRDSSVVYASSCTASQR
jgi:hypothetical protein